MPYSINPKPEPLRSWNANAINVQNSSTVKPSKLSLVSSRVDTKKEDSKTTPVFDDSEAKELEGSKNSKGKPSACVFVASLLYTKTDVELCKSVTDHFEQFGKIVNVKVLRDYSGRPYAFVQYDNDVDSKNAIAQSHNAVLDGRVIRCEAAKVNRTIFITTFNSISKNAVMDTLKEFGETELVVASDQHGRVKHATLDEECRFWFAKFSYRDDAIRAFASLTDDSAYHVEWAKNIEDQCTNGRFDKYTVFVGLLSRLATHNDLERHFLRHGAVKSVSVIHKTLASYGFVTFEEEASAASAVAKDNHTMFMDRNINVQYRELSNYPKMILSSDMPVVLAPPPVNSKFKAAARAKHENEPHERPRAPGRSFSGGLDLAFRARRTSLYTQYRDYNSNWSGAADSYRSWPRSRYGTGGPDAEYQDDGSRYYVVGPSGRK
ncbi:hypothetical protein C7M61_000016 [Candidozyma pseudohaemuli]|uniref:RRM domain-containing protein n=1 Tax=Candidozyma pseudohaemuli TaxID=418784 RepID=A0A2P7YWN4_9ASCO|nr:hypothetical protein C7M61_000016 [[Candida] pseudohaemulonii]PSK40381.1 hypothetical protein C7M61_000016 [[Candida] pseudohaemulonii]